LLKFSVVTPSLNQCKYIEKNIKSVLIQDYPNFEHIIIDGGSIDGTIKILKKYPHLIWVSERDRGQANALNKGFRKATGDIICWLNSDDLLCNNTFFVIRNFFKKNKGIDAVYGNSIVIDEKGSKKYLIKPGEFNFSKLLYRIYSYIPQPSMFFRANLLEEVGYLNEKLKYAMDYDYWIRIGLKKKIMYIDKELSMFRLHGESKTTSNSYEMFEECLALSKKYGAEKFIKYKYYYHKYRLKFIFYDFYSFLRKLKHFFKKVRT